MTTAANPLSLYDRPLKARYSRLEVLPSKATPPSVWRALGYRLFCDDFQMGIAEHRKLSGVQMIRARHEYPSFDWQWVD